MKRAYTKAITGMILWFLPLVTFAQRLSLGNNPSNPGSVEDNPRNPGNIGDNPGDSSVELTNPLKSESLIEFFQDILDVILVFAVPIIVFFIIYAGFKFVMAQGEPGALGDAKRALLYAIIGGVIILGAYVILAVIGGTVDALGS